MLSESALACRRGVLTRAGDWPILTDEPDEGDDAFTSMDLSFLEHHQPDGAGESNQFSTGRCTLLTDV